MAIPVIVKNRQKWTQHKGIPEASLTWSQKLKCSYNLLHIGDDLSTTRLCSRIVATSRSALCEQRISHLKCLWSKSGYILVHSKAWAAIQTLKFVWIPDGNYFMVKVSYYIWHPETDATPQLSSDGYSRKNIRRFVVNTRQMSESFMSSHIPADE